jgi:hypothetical protein
MEDITKQLAEELKKGVESAYHPFLCTLPSDVTFIPAMWSDAKILEMDIKGTQTESDLRNMRHKWDVDAQKYYSESKGEGVSVAEWVWARATLQARGFSFRSKGKREGQGQGEGEGDVEQIIKAEEGGEDAVTVSFIPFITLSNHDDALGGVTTMGSDAKGPTFTFRTGAFKTDSKEQIFNYYGAISFQQKILSFGWVDHCPADSPEGFCITALDIPLGTEGPGSEGSISIISAALCDSKVTENQSMEVEIKSNILLAAAMAFRNRAGKPEETPMSNDLSLKITILKFEIRNIIRKIEERGVSRGRAVEALEGALRWRMTRLTQPIADTDTAPVQTPVPSPVPSKQVPKGQVQRQKSSKRVKPSAAVSKESESDQWEKERAGQSDGQCIRRVELEAVQLLLLYVPTC